MERGHVLLDCPDLIKVGWVVLDGVLLPQRAGGVRHGAWLSGRRG